MKFLLFSGTTEGKIAWEYLKSANACVEVFVATEYGAEVMPEEARAYVKAGRMDNNGMAALFKHEKESGEVAVIDATHPYAAEAGKNIREACFEAGVDYIRFLRPSSGGEAFAEVSNAAEAAEYLSGVSGKVLLTTGSKDLDIFAGTANYSEKLYPRILPVPGGVERCVGLGYRKQNVICMQGPFSAEMNAAILRQIGANWLVTKDTGVAGGYGQKIEGARMAGAKVLLIKRPDNEIGLDFDGFKKILFDKYGLRGKSQAAEAIEEKTGRPFPLLIDMRGKKTLIIGAGEVASRRAEYLIKAGAQVTVITEKASDKILRAAEKGEIKLKIASASEADVQTGYFLICAFSDDKTLNEKICLKAASMDILHNCASDKDFCDVFFPALIEGCGVYGGIVSAGLENHGHTARIAEKLRFFLRDI